METVVLLSGGIDSTACVHYYTDRGFKVSALFIDYGQPDLAQEEQAARAIARYYHIKIKKMEIQAIKAPIGYVRGRNLLLLSGALFAFKPHSGIIALGIHAGTSYPDCGLTFLEKMQIVYDLYEEGKVQIDAPFLTWSKSQIYDYAKISEIPLHLTHSSNKSDLRPEIL